MCAWALDDHTSMNVWLKSVEKINVGGVAHRFLHNYVKTNKGP